MGERELVSDIWKLDFESHWELADFAPSDGGVARLRRLLEGLLVTLRQHLSTVDHAYIAITGLELGQFTPIGSVGRPLAEIHSTPTSGPGTLVAEHIRDLRVPGCIEGCQRGHHLSLADAQCRQGCLDHNDRVCRGIEAEEFL